MPAFHPTRKEVATTLHNLTRGTKIQAHGDPREHPFHCHHEKTVVIDGELAFVGGIDLTDAAGDRYDSSEHHARRHLGWHDVGTRLEGPAVADVAAHFRIRWLELTGEELPVTPPPPPAGDSTVQVVRTIAEGMYEHFPKGEFRIFESYLRAVSGARELIYLENQFLWSPELVSIIADKLRHPPPRISGSSSCCPPGPTTGPRTPRGSSVCSSRPTAATAACSARPSAPCHR